MSYPGNSSLSSDVQQRILGTFDQTLGLAAEGSRQEALLGCDFVLRLDPQFEPARRLQERLKAGTGPVRVDDLRAMVSAAPAEEMFASLEGFDLPELPAALPGGSGADLRAELQALLDQHRLNDIMNRAHQESAAVTADPELRRIVEAAQERLEAEPYVMKFINSAREAQRKGDAAEVDRLIAKARSLNPSHPGIAELERAAMPPGAAAHPLEESSDFSLSFDSPSLSLDSPSLSFDTPSLDAPAALGGGGGFLGGGPGDSETDRRIRQLLDEGQVAFDSGDPQGAIDAWSRIFLIDIDNQEAARRIEQARKLKAEAERQVEEIFHDGLARLEANDLDGARQAFHRVLEIQPGYHAAREYLSQLDAGIVPTLRPAGVDLAAGVSPGAVLSNLDLEADSDLKDEILVPPDPSEMGGRPAERRGEAPAGRTVAMARKSGPNKLFLAIGAVVLVLALAGAYFFLTQRSSLFPNSESDANAVSQTAPLPSPIERATSLHKSGKTDRAISQLERIPEGDPDYAKAQELIQQWKGGAAAAAGAAATAPAVDPRRQELIASAQAAYQEQSYLVAAERFAQANTIARLEGAEAEAFADAKNRLQPIAKYLSLYRQHEWELILPDLWRLRESDPRNRDVNRLLVDSYYNMGVRDLQRADARKAVEQLQEAVNLDPHDEALRRTYLFAQTYQERPKDLLYRIYVKYLPFRG